SRRASKRPSRRKSSTASRARSSCSRFRTRVAVWTPRRRARPSSRSSRPSPQARAAGSVSRPCASSRTARAASSKSRRRSVAGPACACICPASSRRTDRARRAPAGKRRRVEYTYRYTGFRAGTTYRWFTEARSASSLGGVREGPFRRNFGRAVKTAREGRGLTQRELAETARIADKYLSRIELGMATPSVYVASRLAQALGVSVDALIVSSPKLADQELASVLRLLHALEPSELERVQRILLEVLR